jgi:drug/metabolite transporter (DMT)-like permease
MAADDRELAVVCGLISLPFHYVFWTSIFELVRDRPSMSLTASLVVAAMGCAAISLSYLAFALITSRISSSTMRLPNPILYVASVLLVANAIFQFESRHVLWGVESLAVSLGAFLLARRRGEK